MRSTAHSGEIQSCLTITPTRVEVTSPVCSSSRAVAAKEAAAWVDLRPAAALDSLRRATCATPSPGGLADQ